MNWVGDLGTAKKIHLFYHVTPDLIVFLVFCCILSVQLKKIEARPKFKVGGLFFWAHMYAYNVFFEILKFWLVYERLKIITRNIKNGCRWLKPKLCLYVHFLLYSTVRYLSNRRTKCARV